jgi:hypothetical protein
MSTIVGREKIDHPSLGAAGGSALHVAIETIYTNVGNDMSARFKSYAAIANSVVTTVDHNFGVDFADLNLYLYTGTHPTLVRVSDPVAAGWVIAATSGFLKTKIDITAPSSGGPHTFVLYAVHGSIGIDDLTNVNLTVAAEDGQALVYETASTSWKAGASGDASFKIQSISTPNAVIKGGYILLDNGKELATYDGAGSASTDFGKDITVSLTTILGSAPADATAYYLYIDLNSLAAPVTLTDNGRKVYSVVQANFVLSTTAPDVIDLARYVPRAVIKSATAGTAWSGAGSAFATLAFLAGQTVDGSLKTFVRPQVTQTAHGFTSSNLGAPLYLTAGGVYTLAKADAANTAEVGWLIYSIPDVNTLILALDGRVTVDTAVSGGAMVVGSTYYVSASSAGLLTSVEPSIIGTVSKPLGVAISTTVLEFVNMRGVTVGGTNALTTIAFANNATSTIQSVSSYQGGELSGYVSIVATTSIKFFIKAQFSKNAAGTDFNFSYQTSGETPPASFVMSVTSAGLIQITIGSLAGFVSASITYGLNVPAVGATFPLSIQASKVAGAIDGAAVAAGYVGELVTSTGWSAPIFSLTSTLGDVPGASISLTPGVWHLFYALTVDIRTANPPAAGDLVQASLGIYTGANVLVSETWRNIRLSYPNAGTTGAAVANHTVSGSKVITLSAITTYKIRGLRTTSGTADIYYIVGGGLGNAESSFYAIRIA